MTFQDNPFLILQLVSAAITFGLGVYILTRPQKKRESNVFSILMFAGSLWSFGNALQWLSPNLIWQSVWNAIAYLGIVIIPTAWFLFAVKFTGYGRRFIEKWEYLFWFVPFFFYLALLTNPAHHLFFSSQELIASNGFLTLESFFGPLFYAHTYYSYILLFLGLVFIGYAIISNPKRYGNQLNGLIIGVLAPLVGNILYLTGNLPEGFPDPTPIFFTITGLAFAWAIFGGGILEPVSVAHDQVVQKLNIGIVVLDLEDRILNINPAALELLRLTEINVINQSLTNVIDKKIDFYDVISEAINHSQNFASDITLNDYKREKTYKLEITEIQNRNGVRSGRLLQFSDISLIEQAEENVATTQHTLETVLDTLQDGYFEADPTGLLTYVNMAFVHHIGLERREDVIGKNFRNFTDKKAVGEIIEKFGLLYKTKQPLESFEYNYRTNEGKHLIGETTVSPIMDGDKVVGSRGIIRDITPRVMAEREISEQRNLLGSLLHHAPLAIVINDLENKITVVNPAFEELFGYTQSEVVGKELDEILSTPETLKDMRYLTEVGQHERAYSVGKRKKKDNTIIDVEVFLEPFYVGDRKFGLLVFFNDISERLKVETDLKKIRSTYFSVLDTLQDVYFEADRAGIITYVNQAFLKQTRHLNKDDIVGKHFRHVITKESFRIMVENFGKMYQTGEPIDPFDLTYRTKDGTEFTSEIVVSPIVENGDIIGSRGIVRDITVRVEAENILREARDAAEHRADELTTLNRLASSVTSSLNLEAILQSVCEEITDVFPIRNAGIALLGDDHSTQEIVAFHSTKADEESVRGMIIRVQKNDASWEAINTKKPVIIDDAPSDNRAGSMKDVYKNRGTKAIIIVPLLARGKVVGTIGMPAKNPNHIFTKNEVELAETIASQIAAAVDNAQLHAQTELALDVAERDLEIGREIQSGFFPEIIPEIPGWEIASHFQAARQVAGDFYDIFQFRNSNLTAFIIADVCDKGVGAALFMVLIRSLLRAFSEIDIDEHNVKNQLKAIVLNTNNFIAEYHGRSNMFATMFFGVLDPASGVLYFINGGHEPPVIMDRDGRVIKRLMPTGPAVGLFPNMGFTVEQIQVNEGDSLIGFTDGVTDAKNNLNEVFTEEQLLDRIQAPWTSIFSMVFELYTSLRNHIGDKDQYDDITLISFRRKQSEEVDYHAICRSARLDNLTELRDFVSAAATQSGLNSEDVFAFKLVAEEVCANIIQYGYTGEDRGFIAMAFQHDNGKARLSIWDDGKYFPPEEADTPKIEAGLKERKIGGLGLYFVKELMDHISYNKDENNNNILVLEKVLSTDA